MDLCVSQGWQAKLEYVSYIPGPHYGGYTVYTCQLIRGRENTSVMKCIFVHTHKNQLPLPFPSAFSFPVPRSAKGIAH